MKYIVFFSGFILSAQLAVAQDSQPPALTDPIKNYAGGLITKLGSTLSWSLPSLPNLTLDAVGTDWVNTVVQEVNDTLPAVQKMGFEVVTLSIQVSVPPRAHLRLRSTSATGLDDAAAKAGQVGKIASTVIESAATAKHIQSATKLGTVILDVDIGVSPKITMTFMGASHKADETSERTNEDLDMSSAEAVEH
jgi:hypothetical protein